MKSFSPLLSILLVAAANGQNFSPSPLDHVASQDQQNEVTPIIQTKPFVHKQSDVNQQRPQVQQQIVPALGKKSPQLAPVQPSSDLLPPGDIIDNSDYEGFSNVKTKPLSKLKRDNEGQAEAQEVSARFLAAPGYNWGWTGSQGGNNNYQKPGSCYRGEYNGNNNNIYNSYARSYRVKRQYTPYYNGNNNNGGFGSSGGYYYPVNNNNGYNPSGPIHGGNGGYNPGGPIHGGNGGGNGISYCYRDNDCPGNKKCCDGYCRTPAYVG